MKMPRRRSRFLPMAPGILSFAGWMPCVLVLASFSGLALGWSPASLPFPRPHHLHELGIGTSPPTDRRNAQPNLLGGLVPTFNRRNHRYPHHGDPLAFSERGVYLDNVYTPQLQGQRSTLLLPPAQFQQNLGLTCAHCRRPLGNEWTEYENQKYHPHCYQQFVQIKCGVCHHGLDGAWFVSDPWGNKAHAHHGHDPTVSCTSCQRIIGDDTSQGGRELSDGRVICGVCETSAITQGGQIPKALNRVFSDLRQVMTIHGFQGRIDLRLADRDELTERAQGAGCAHGNFHGLTTTTRITTDRVVMEHEITLLQGLPDLQFRGVLAHELLHVWLNEAGLQPPTDLMEGFCNLGSHAVYITAPLKDQGFAQILLQQMEEDPDPVYGDGYRTLKGILEREGWQGVFAKIMSYQRG